MLARIRKSMKENDRGFTLIELLVVMIIIGILAAIAVPVFLSQREKAQDSAAKSDASAIGKALASYYVDGTVAPKVEIASSRYQISYTPSGASAATTVDVGKVSSGVVLWENTSSTQSSTSITLGTDSMKWCIGVSNPNGSQKTYKFSAQNGLESGTCSSVSAP